MTFTELGREKQYRGHVFDVARVHVRLPNGREREYDLVEHGDSVSVVPVDNRGNILFVSQHRLGSGGDLLELPAGVLDPGESPLASAQRELREETGMAAREIKELGGFYLAPGYTDEFMTVFLATDLYNSPLEADEDEFLNLKALPIEEAYQKARNHELRDGKTLASLLLAQPFLEKSA
jgi:ADP-ribose pyrophosphatase